MKLYIRAHLINYENYYQQEKEDIYFSKTDDKLQIYFFLNSVVFFSFHLRNVKMHLFFILMQFLCYGS